MAANRKSYSKAKEILGEDISGLLFEIAPFVGPRMDVFKTNAAFFISLDLAGAERKDISLKLAGKMLVIEGIIQESRLDQEIEWLISERYSGSFRREVLLPDDCMLDRVHAEFRRGILWIKTPFWQSSSTAKH